MTVTTECELTVGIADLQHAIAAVAPHADKAKQGDEQPVTCRIRLTAGKDHLAVSATDTRTSAVAWVVILADSRKDAFKPEDGPFVVDLLPKHARALAESQTPRKLEGDDLGECTLILALDEVTITDRSGKYPGVSHTVVPLEQEGAGTLPGTEELRYPPVERLVGQAFGRAYGTHKVLLPPTGMLSRFEIAAREYGDPLVIEPVGDAEDTGWLVWCGTRFAGQLLARPEADADTRRRNSRRLQYLRRLGLLSDEDEARIALGGDDVHLGDVDEPGDDEQDDENGEDD